MDIIVCVKRVPDVSEGEIEPDASGHGLRDQDLAWDVNEWDNFAIEAAVRLKEELGGTVTALTVGGEDDEDVLRRALAMGADAAVHLMDEAFAGSDSWGVARILEAAIKQRPHDLILTGAMASDTVGGQLAGLLAGLLDLPHVVLATGIEHADGKLRVRHEVEGGLERRVELELPAVVSVQTGCNEPRYVSIRGIRKVASIEIPVAGADELGLDQSSVGSGAARVVDEQLFEPPRGEGAELLEGSTDEVVEALVERLKAKGVL